MMARTRKTILIVAVLLLVAGGAAAGILAFTSGSPIPKDLRGVVLERPVPLGTVELVTKAGSMSFPPKSGERWTLMSIGYTHCPDVCPFILGNLAQVEKAMRKTLPSEAIPRVAFLSVDPDRDHPKELGKYAAYFSDDFIGMTGSKAAIDAIVGDLGGTYRFGPKDAEGFYEVFHSAEIYLIDPQGRLYARFAPPIDPTRMTVQMQRIRKFHDRPQT